MKLGVKLVKVPQQTVSKPIHHFTELGHESDHTGKERKRTANTSANYKVIKKRLQRNSRVSMRQFARETGISKSLVHRIAKRELNLNAYKFQKHWATGQRWERIFFTDEKLFTLEQAQIHQNDRRWPGFVPVANFPPLVFVDREVKINQEVYRREILKAVALPRAQKHFGDANCTFQQDSTPAHKVKLLRTVVRLCLIRYANVILPTYGKAGSRVREASVDVLPTRGQQEAEAGLDVSTERDRGQPTGQSAQYQQHFPQGIPYGRKAENIIIGNLLIAARLRVRLHRSRLTIVFNAQGEPHRGREPEAHRIQLLYRALRQLYLKPGGHRWVPGRLLWRTVTHLIENISALVRWNLKLRGTLPESLRRNIIYLVPKPHGCPGLNRYRPISLPTVDYKIVSGVIMGCHLPAIVAEC
ncbi:hypothetical protein LAZ67_17000091 [Cordylochernes scorpioides]|uniref:Transposase n=1 Tax=Cordylochernes scorpioides TaxID=51811 RepID=A0ABY6LCH5_9ARAC|nr:hypothetical protein LAZ67_17000091 [Cordylochernes scorpioides]